MKHKVFLLGLFLVVTPSANACFGIQQLLRMVGCGKQARTTPTNVVSELKESDDDHSKKLKQVEEVTKEEIDRLVGLWRNKEISEQELKRIFMVMYAELIFVLPFDRLQSLFPFVTLQKGEAGNKKED